MNYYFSKFKTQFHIALNMQLEPIFFLWKNFVYLEKFVKNTVYLLVFVFKNKSKIRQTLYEITKVQKLRNFLED